ncbi:hypothetical protein FRC10_011081 [Ceratobasidium sp. 414]|nr:hypothetical protein FRC10_011081 [Ceratobasidium sp. 414]
MKNVFAVVIGFGLAVPGLLASPTPLDLGVKRGGGGYCIPKGECCKIEDPGKCCSDICGTVPGKEGYYCYE